MQQTSPRPAPRTPPTPPILRGGVFAGQGRGDSRANRRRGGGPIPAAPHKTQTPRFTRKQSVWNWRRYLASQTPSKRLLTQIADVAPDLKLGELGDPNSIAPVHLEGTGPEVSIDREGCLLAEEGAAHAQNVNSEMGLSRQHQEHPTQEAHAQIVGAEPDPEAGEPDVFKEVAHAKVVVAEPDLQMGQSGDPNANTPEGVAHARIVDAEPGLTSGKVINPDAVLRGPDTLERVTHTQIVGMERDLTRREVADLNMDARAHLEGAE